MSIKQKLYSLGAIAVIGVLVMLATTTHFSQTTETLNQAINLVDKLEIRLLNLRRNEKDFLLRSDVKYLETFKKNSTLFLDLEQQLSLILLDRDLPLVANSDKIFWLINKVLKNWCRPIAYTD